MNPPKPRTKRLTWADAVKALQDGAKELAHPSRDYTDQERGQALSRAASYLMKLEPTQQRKRKSPRTRSSVRPGANGANGGGAE